MPARTLTLFVAIALCACDATRVSDTGAGQQDPVTLQATATYESPTSHAELGKRLHTYFRPFAQNRMLSGVVRIERGGELVYQGLFGQADFEAGEPVVPDTRFGIASISKTFTAHALTLLVERGEASWDDPLSKYVPDLVHARDIKLLHLVRFESGLPEIFDLIGGDDRDLTREEYIAELNRADLLWEPGSEGAYGNTGFYMIALVIESVSGTSFEEFLNHEFFEPVGMKNTGDRSRLAGLEDDGLATPYQPGPPPALLHAAPYASPTLSLGAGSLYSTGKDLAAWGLAVARDRFVDLDQQDYPWGWGRDEYAGRSSLNQTGMTSGFTAALYVVPEDETVVSIVNNVEFGLWNAWGGDALRILYGEAPIAATKPYDYLPAPDPKLARAAEGRYRMNEERVFDVAYRADGQLYMTLNEWPVWRHMLPLRDGGFQLRDFTGQVFFVDEGEDGQPDLLRHVPPDHWGGDPEIYRRVEDG
jgi:CubicO group peptidase (beta-lactamase class C family)